MQEKVSSKTKASTYCRACVHQRGKTRSFLRRRALRAAVEAGVGRRMLTSETVENLRAFMYYAGSFEGDEKGEAQVFCDRLFRAFGHEGYK